MSAGSTPHPHFFARNGGVYEVRWFGTVIGTVARHGRGWVAAKPDALGARGGFTSRRTAAAWLIDVSGVNP